MRPVPPVGKEGQSLVLAEHQPEYVPLPCTLMAGPDGRIATQWELDEHEREAVAAGAPILLTLLTFGHPLQPIEITVGLAPNG